jgi:hypothetical protein
MQNFKNWIKLSYLNKTVLNSPINIIIDYDFSYKFYLIEELNVKFSHPVNDYYLKLNDLSINLLVSLKWIKWAYKFFTSLIIELDRLDENYALDDIISKSIQDFKKIKIKENSKIITIDDYPINSEEALLALIEKFYKNPVFNSTHGPIFDSNTKVHLKLKLNLREYLIISNLLFPTLIKFLKK